MKKKWGTKYEENLEKCQQAAQETKGIVLWYHETFAWAPFHQSSNGKTRDVQEVLGNADYPYITAKECPLDKAAEDEIQVHLIEYKEIQKRCREFLVAEEQKKQKMGMDTKILKFRNGILLVMSGKCELERRYVQEISSVMH